MTFETYSVVEAFWERAGTIEPFPRDLVNSAELALPLRIVSLSPLELSCVERWFWQRGSRFRFNCESRMVRGCLIAYGGNGFIFIDGSDCKDERRFTVAHEVSHFLIDYWYPRQRALKKYGTDIVEVLDGQRTPTPSERISALLSRVPIGLQMNLMERGNVEEVMNVWKVENRADRIAVALLAPTEAVLRLADLSGMIYQERIDVTVSLLQADFGLPAPVARGYAVSLLSSAGKGPSWTELLKLK